MKKNHCGASSNNKSWWGRLFSAVLSSDLIPGGEMNDSCELHDIAYETLGKSKEDADREFLESGLRHNWWNPYGWVKSAAYYLAVKFGGNKSYREAQAKAQIKQDKEIITIIDRGAT